MPNDLQAFFAITVEFTHEADGQRKPMKVDFARRTSRKAYGAGVFEMRVLAALEKLGVVKPEIANIDYHIDKPQRIGDRAASHRM